MQTKTLLAFSALVAAAMYAVRADTLSLSPDGVQIDGGSMGTFTLTYPLLGADGEGGKEGIVERKVSGNTATIRYDSGATLSVQLDGGRATYTYRDVRANVKKAFSGLRIPIAFAQGGRWQVNGGEETAFPATKPPQPHLYAGNATAFTLVDHAGKSFTLQVPPYGWLEVNDLREWNDATYFLGCQTLYQASYQMTITEGASGARDGAAALVDRFGQLNTSDWPGKVKGEGELADDAKSEEEYYTSFPLPDRDAFGGSPGSGKKLGLQETGFFHVEKQGDKWMLVDPDGNLFFHAGVCGFQPCDDYTTVKGRPDAFEFLPPVDGEFATAYRPGQGNEVFSFHTANMIRKYHRAYDLAEFQTRMIERVRRFGFNSAGAFSSPSLPVIKAKNFPYVSEIPLDGIDNIPGINQTWDPFDPANVARIKENFARSLPAHAADPLLIGYFLTNEPLYEDIPKQVAALRGTHWACKRALVKMLSDKYHTIQAFDQAWGISARSFEQLEDEPLAVTSQEAAGDVHAFTGLFLETYYKLVADTFHQHDTHHLLIGNRFQSGTINDEQLCRIAGRYLDVMSFNYYTYALDKEFLARIYQWTGRPMFLSEFYWGSDKESGLSGGREVSTQRDRGLAYRNYVEGAAATGFVVGVEWFSLLDQAATGRFFEGFTGERANIGLFSVTDRPYKPMVAEMARTNAGIYDVITGAKPPFVYDDPRFAQSGGARLNATVPHSRGPITLDGGTRNWPGTPAEVLSGKRVVHGSDAGGTEGAFKVCWDEHHLYLLVNVVDPTPMQNKQTSAENLWNGDGIEVFLGHENLDQGGNLQFSDRQLMIGAAGSGKAPYYYANSARQSACDTLIVPHGDGQGYTVEAAIPWEALGVTPKVGTRLLFDLGLDDSTNGEGRQHQLMWNGTERNSHDRTHWGTATLLE